MGTPFGLLFGLIRTGVFYVLRTNLAVDIDGYIDALMAKDCLELVHVAARLQEIVGE